MHLSLQSAAPDTLARNLPCSGHVKIFEVQNQKSGIVTAPRTDLAKRSEDSFVISQRRQEVLGARLPSPTAVSPLPADAHNRSTQCGPAPGQPPPAPGPRDRSGTAGLTAG